jgi:hypothetical protein
VAELRRLVGEGPVVTLKGEVTPEQLQAVADRTPGVSLISASDGAASFSAADAGACSALVRELFAAATKVDDLRVQEPTLEALFLKLTGRELRD